MSTAPHLFRLELDAEEVEDPFIVQSTGPERELRCEVCRSTWFDPLPAALSVDVEEPEGGWDQLRPGVMPGGSTPVLVVAPEVASVLRARGVLSFEEHPVRVGRIDGEPASADQAGGPWVALWALGTARELADPDSGAPLPPCDGCGRFHGEFEAPFGAAIDLGGWDGGDLFAVPGWRYTTFATDRAVEALKSAGVRFLRAVPVQSYGVAADGKQS